MEPYLITICDDIKNETPQEISSIRFHGTWSLDAIKCTSQKITRAFVAMRQMLTFSTLPEKVVTLAQELYKLKEEVNEILADQNDINESTRAQLDAISLALSELQASRSQNATLKNRRPIGFIQPKKDEE